MMLSWVNRSFSILVFLLLVSQIMEAQNLPPRPDPPRLVNDLTNSLNTDQINRLEQKLVSYNDSTSTQIAVVLINTLDGYPIEEYAFRMGESWGIGQKGKNNGVLVLAAMTDRKIFIATGYGMEAVMPDALVKRIIEQDIKPAFRKGDIYGGLDKATDNMIRLAAGEYQADQQNNNEGEGGGILFVLLMFLLIFGIVIMSKVKQAKRYSIVNHIPFWTAWTLLNAASRKGGWGKFHGGGGSFGGGGFGGGGGGFGGFGGGSFGGGGAGGSW